MEFLILLSFAISGMCLGVAIHTRRMNTRLTDLLFDQCNELLVMRAKYERVGDSE